MGRFELLEKQPPSAEKKIKKSRLPDARGYDITEGYAYKLIRKTAKERPCCFCGTLIPAGSRAKERIQVVNKKLMVHAKEYIHVKGQCPPIAE